MNKFISPGEILLKEFLVPMKISQYRLAKETKLSQMTISRIIRNKQAITTKTAVCFAKFFANTPQFWLNLQNEYDLRVNNNG